MFLAHRELEEFAKNGGVKVAGGDPLVIDPVSIALRINGVYLEYRHNSEHPSDVPVELPSRIRRLAGESYLLPPGGKVLTATLERVCLPLDFLGFIHPKSSLARGFLFIATGIVDPGYEGALTIAIHNASDHYYNLDHGLACGQLLIASLNKGNTTRYQGRYLNEDAPVGMKR